MEMLVVRDLAAMGALGIGLALALFALRLTRR
jgi:hypothetical protein